MNLKKEWVKETKKSKTNDIHIRNQNGFGDKQKNRCNWQDYSRTGHGCPSESFLCQ